MQTLTCETNGSYDVSVSVGASPLDTTTILNGTVSHTYPQDVWISSSLEVCHYFLMTSVSRRILGSPLMEAKRVITKQHKYNKVIDIANSNAKSQSTLQITHSVNAGHLRRYL